MMEFSETKQEKEKKRCLFGGWNSTIYFYSIAWSYLLLSNQLPLLFVLFFCYVMASENSLLNSKTEDYCQWCAEKNIPVYNILMQNFPALSSVHIDVLSVILIEFIGMLSRPRISYSERLGNHVHCTIVFTFDIFCFFKAYSSWFTRIRIL